MHMRTHCAFQGYLHKHLKETLGLAKFCNVAIVYKQKEKEAAHHSDAAAHEHEMFTMAHLLVCERSTSRTATNNCESGHAPDGSCMSLPRGGAHTVYFAKLERVCAINTSAAR